MIAQFKPVLALLAAGALLAGATGAGAQTSKATPELKFKADQEQRLKGKPKLRVKPKLVTVKPAPGAVPCPTCMTPDIAAAPPGGITFDRFGKFRVCKDCMLPGVIAGVPDMVSKPYSLPDYPFGTGTTPQDCPQPEAGPNLTGAVTAADEIGLFNDSATMWTFGFSDGTDVRIEVLAPNAIRILKVVPNRIYSMNTSNLQFTTLIPGNIYRIYVRDLAWKIE